MSNSKKFYRGLGGRIIEKLPSGYKFFRSALEWRKRVDNSYNIIAIHGNNTYSPHVGISFSFGKKYDDIEIIEKLMGCKYFRTHIQVGTSVLSNKPQFPYLGPSYWNINIENPPENLEVEIMWLIEGLGFPFFNQFPTVEDARNEMQKTKRTWCKGFHWMQYFHIKAVLDEMDEFVEWSQRLDPFQKDLADKYIEKYISLSATNL